MFNESTGFTNYTPYTDKQQLLLQGQAGSNLIISNFRNTAQIVSEGIGIYTLSYARDHYKLAVVRAAVTDCIA